MLRADACKATRGTSMALGTMDDIRLYLALHNLGIVLPFLYLENGTDPIPGMRLAFGGSSMVIPLVLAVVSSWLLVYRMYKGHIAFVVAIACGAVIGAVPGLFYFAMSDALQVPVPVASMVTTGLFTGAIATACVHALELRRRANRA